MTLETLDLLSIGHALVDIRILVEHLPRPDEEAMILDERRGVGGSAANTAIAARRLGLKTAIVAKIGLDGFARLIVDELIREKVLISGIRVSLTTPTGFSIVVRDVKGNIIVYGFKGASEELTSKEIPQDLIEAARAIHVASLRPDTAVEAMCRAAKLDKLVSWDPGRVIARQGVSKLSRLLGCAKVALVNRVEARLLTGVDDYRKAARIIAEHGPSIVVVKKGSEGAYVYSGEEEFEEPAYPVEKVVDTTGAGDTFAAGFIAGLLWGWSLRDAAKLASMAAALKVSRLGSHEAPTIRELLDYASRIGVKLPKPPLAD